MNFLMDFVRDGSMKLGQSSMKKLNLSMQNKIVHLFNEPMESLPKSMSN